MNRSHKLILTRDEIMRSVEAFIRPKLNGAGMGPGRLGVKDSLVCSGLLKSADVLDLVFFLENEFGLDILTQDVDVANLDSLWAIADFLSPGPGKEV
jgi:hypothetical protein